MIKLNKFDYNMDPFEKIVWPVGRHSSLYFQFDSRYGDIKRVWELNRLQYLDPILVAFLVNDKEAKKRYIAFFIDTVESWLEQNPHEQTVAWACS
jgi:hypothetical protein